MSPAPSSEYVGRAVANAVRALTDQRPGASPEVVGATAAAVAAALHDAGASSAEPVVTERVLPKGVRFVTGPAAVALVPDPEAPGPVHVMPGIVPGVVPGGPQPGDPGPDAFPAVVGPAVISPWVQNPTPIEPGPYPGGPQPIEPGPYPGGPQPIAPGGMPWQLEPTFGVLVFEQFLDHATAARLADLVRVEHRSFLPSTVINDGVVSVDTTRRAARSLPETPEWVVDCFVPRLDALLEFACSRFGVTPDVAAHQWDVHVTVTPLGGGFVPHIDNGNPLIADRVLSWVYYLGNGGVSGGDLTLYDAREPRALLEGLTRRASVAPEPNTLVIFPSWLVHEITPVIPIADSGGATPDELGRKTVHGWLRWPRR